MVHLKRFAVLILVMVSACAVPYTFKADQQRVRATVPDKPLMVSLGRAEIIPPSKSVPMAGYGVRYKKNSRGADDKLYARAILFTEGDHRMAIVNADLLIMTSDVRAAVLEKVKDLKLDAVLLATTHTHAGMGGYVNSFPWEAAAVGTYHRVIFDTVVNTFASALRDASQATPFEAKIAVASTQAPDFVRNRRHDGGPTDPTLSIIRIDDTEGKTRAIIVNYGAHPTVMPGTNRRISGDYAGVLERALEQKVELAMFLAADIGDQKPHRPGLDKDPETFADATAIGEGLAEIAWKLAEGSTPKSASITVADEQFALPPGDLNKACMGIFHAPLEGIAKHILPKTTLFQAWGIDGALLLTSPGELAHEVGMELRSRFPDNIVFPVSHSNDYVGYVISKEEYLKGGYESCMNFYGPEFTGMLMDTLTTLGRKVQ